jgi:hypothetical protein
MTMARVDKLERFNVEQVFRAFEVPGGVSTKSATVTNKEL